MSIPVKIISGTESGTIKKGNFAFGVSNTRTYGPTSETGFYKGHTIPDGGYVFYLDRGTASPSAYVCGNDSDLISIVNAVSGENYQTVSDAISWVNTQSGAVAFDKPFNSVVTDGLVFNLDAGSLISYSGTGSTWYDVSGNENNGTLVNEPTFTSIGALLFDGVNDSISRSYNSTFNIRTGLTLSVTIKRNSIFTQLADCFFLSRVPSWYFYDSFGTGDIRGEIFIDGVRRGARTTSLPNDGKFYNIVYTYDSSTGLSSIYKNGLLSSATQLTGLNNYLIDASTSNFAPLFFSNSGKSYYVSDVKIYNKSLSSQEISQNYYRSPIVTDGLFLAVDAGNLASYENGSTTVYNLSGNQNGTLENGVGYSKNRGGTWTFDGVDDRISFSSFNISYLTVSLWVYKTSSVSNQGICRKQNVWAISQQNGTLRAAPGTNWAFSDTGYLIPLNTWINIVYRYSGSGSDSQSVFINGSLIWSSSSGTGPLPSQNTSMRIGFDQNNWWWGGLISTTQIYNRALSQEEIYNNFEAQRRRFGI